jgi:hypothetical protein
LSLSQGIAQNPGREHLFSEYDDEIVPPLPRRRPV